MTELPADAAVVLLVRHASAGDPTMWRGADADRPLDERGRRQAEQIAAVLPAYQPVKVISAPPVRCVDTVSGVAAAVGVELEIDPLFGEDGAPADPERHLLDVLVPGAAVVVCSQGGVIPRILHALLPAGRRVHARKGSVWVLTLHDGRLVQAEDDLLS
ncbi:MAG: histidine phosphatase family protein [Frankiaceae bacterium]|nr:histidine phosphatase family protein [Frankiaceae bacterium]